MCKGFVKIPRRLFETRWWNQKRIYSESDAIIDLYQSADKKNMVSGSRRSYADRWLWDDTRVHRFFTRLQKDGYIKVEKTIRGTVIEILDFGTGAPPSAPPTAPPTAPPSAPPRAYKNDIIISCLSKNNKNNPPLPPKGYESILFDFVDERFLDILFEWLEFKNDRRERYKNERSLKLLYKKLLDLSDADPIKARKVVEQSMANNWSGLFELKENKKQSYENSRRNNGAEQTVAAATEAIAELLADNR